MTPIIFFAFNRPDTTQRVLEALSRQTKPIPRLIAFCDGARHPEETQRVQQVRQLVRSVTWTEVELIERKRNYGLVDNIVSGIDAVLSRYERAIIVEDDILTAPHFYEALCLMLDHYQAAENVFSVGGYPVLLANVIPQYPYDVIMSVRFSVWGWGTWAERWQEVSPLIRGFKNPYGSAEAVPPDMGQDIPIMLKELEKDPNYTWDIQIVVLCYYKNYLHALSRKYLVNNLGLETGSHGSKKSARFLKFIRTNNPLNSVLPKSLPPPVRDEVVVKMMQNYISAVRFAAKTRYFNKFRYYFRRILYHLRRLASLDKD